MIINDDVDRGLCNLYKTLGLLSRFCPHVSEKHTKPVIYTFKIEITFIYIDLQERYYPCYHNYRNSQRI